MQRLASERSELHEAWLLKLMFTTVIFIFLCKVYLYYASRSFVVFHVRVTMERANGKISSNKAVKSYSVERSLSSHPEQLLLCVLWNQHNGSEPDPSSWKFSQFLQQNANDNWNNQISWGANPDHSLCESYLDKLAWGSMDLAEIWFPNRELRSIMKR